MTTKHTPGPWTIHNQPDGDWTVETHTPYTYGVATVHAPSEAEERSEGEANARVIAAAPAMLTALRRMVDGVSQWERDGQGCALCGCNGHTPESHADDCPVRDAREAIAKAEGR